MKLQVLQENLSKALSIASRFSSSRAQLPVLGNILFLAKKTKLVLSSTNLETSIAISLGAQIKEEGELTIPSRIITEIITNLSPGTLTLESDKEHLKIVMQNFSSKIMGMNSADFPKVPQVISKEESLFLPKNQFFEALSQVLFSVSPDESRPILTGVLFIFSRNSLCLVATDGFRLSQKKITLDAQKEKQSSQRIVLPKNVLLELSRLGEEDDELQFSLKEKENQVLFGVENIVLSSRILEGQFPDYEKIIPKSSLIKIRVDKEEFLRAVKLASVFARDSANIVRINLEKDAIRLSAESSQSGSQEASLDAKIDGETPLEIAFNYRFLEEFIHTVKGEEVLLEFTNSSSPGVFTDPKDPDYLHLVMPVKIQG